jgi:hypothetical protein
MQRCEHYGNAEHRHAGGVSIEKCFDVEKKLFNLCKHQVIPTGLLCSRKFLF